MLEKTITLQFLKALEHIEYGSMDVTTPDENCISSKATNRVFTPHSICMIGAPLNYLQPRAIQDLPKPTATGFGIVMTLRIYS